MINERLFYFIHGFVTMWFLMAGWRRFSHHESSRLEGLCGVILLYWGFLELKDLFFYATPIIRDNYISNILILVDMTAIPAGFCFIEVKSPPSAPKAPAIAEYRAVPLV